MVPHLGIFLWDSLNKDNLGSSKVLLEEEECMISLKEADALRELSNEV